jgi:hypothetical protein
MADKIEEAMEIRKKHCLKVYEKIEKSEEELQTELAKLKSYMWYFKIIYDNYKKDYPVEIKKAEDTGFPIGQYNEIQQIQGYGMCHFLMVIKIFDITFEAITLIAKVSNQQATEYIDEIKKGLLTNKELKEKSKLLEDVSADYFEKVRQVIKFSITYINFMKKLQAAFPEEYVKYIKQE